MTVATSMYCDLDCDEIVVAEPGEHRREFIARCRTDGWVSIFNGTRWANTCPKHKETT